MAGTSHVWPAALLKIWSKKEIRSSSSWIVLERSGLPRSESQIWNSPSADWIWNQCRPSPPGLDAASEAGRSIELLREQSPGAGEEE
jgi:hypothetical protein